MERKRIVIVGGVAAGASAAAKARRSSEDVEIVLVEAGPYISFANCGLPYYIGEEITSRDKLFVVKESLFARRFNFDVRCRTRAVSIDREKRTVEIVWPADEPDSGGRMTMPYDRLILATGTIPVRPRMPGLNAPNFFSVRTVPDVDAIVEFRSRLTTEKQQRALVIGGGYIGLETAEQLCRRGIHVVLVEMADQLMSAIDREMAYPIQEALEREGARIILSDAVKEIVHEDGRSVARTTRGEEIPFDLGILAAGVRPAVELAKASGIALGETGAIAVDAWQRTSDPAIFAAGDNCEVTHLVTGKLVNIPLAGPANKMGRVAGANAVDDLDGLATDDPRRIRFRGVLGTSVVRVGDRLAAATGLTEKQACREQVPHKVTYMMGASHAGYYPGAEQMILKVLHDPANGRLLGAQAVGGKGVDKRVDVLATAITGGLGVEDLEHLDLCYAPPVGSAKDLPIMAGFAGANIRRGVMPVISPGELCGAEESKSRPAPFLLDVRSPGEFSGGHLPGAVNIPIDELRSRMDEVPCDRPIAVYCLSGYRSYLGQRILMNRGWEDVSNVQGGFRLIELFRKARAGTQFENS